MSRRYGSILAVAIVLLIVAAGLFLPQSSQGQGPPWYAAGDFNGWAATDQMYDDGTHGDAVAGDGIYSLLLDVATAGRYEWKVNDGTWDVSYPPSNAWYLTTAADQDVLLTFDTNSYTDGWLPAVNIVNSDDGGHTWVAVGDWQGWNNASTDTVMTLKGGVYQYTTVIATAGVHQYKVVRSGSWDAMGPDGASGGRSINSSDLPFTTTEDNQRVTFYADATTGRLRVDVWGAVFINEIQVSTTGADWEFFELQGVPETALSGLTLVGIESDAGSLAGTIDTVIDLDDQTIPADGFWLGISPVGAAAYDVTGEMSIPDGSFENSTATYFLVLNFTGAQDDDLDGDDDGVLDSTPWDAILDGINLRDSASDFDYGAFSVGPDGSYLPSGTFRCPNAPDGTFDDNMLNFSTPDGTPGTANICPVGVVISEVRIDQPSTDNDEYFELAGAPGTALDDLAYLVIGDGDSALGSGVIENVTDLAGQVIPASGYFVAAEGTFTLGTADLVTSLNFENSDNVTHLLVQGFTGANGDDLDTDDDGVLDVTPWIQIVDLIALVEEENPPAYTEYHYGPPSVGPDGSYVPGHAFRCDPDWQIGAFDPVGGDDTPGAANLCPVRVGKTGSGCSLPGEDLVYTLSIHNMGALDATGVVLSDTLPADTTYVSDDSGWPCPACIPGASGALTWSVGTVPSSTMLTFDLTVAIDGGTAAKTVLENVATITGTLPGGGPADWTATWSTLIGPLRIHDVQGAAQVSPYDGQEVCGVPGIVTAVTSNSFYMQDPSPDADDATSEGILVYTGSSPTVAVGDEVEVSAQVQEYYPGGFDTGNLSITELGNPSVEVDSSGNPLPAPTIVGQAGRQPPTEVIDDDGNTTFDAAADGLDFYESMESMRVQLEGAVAVGPTNAYGEIPVVTDGQAYGGVYTPRDGIVIQADDYNPERVILDDALAATPNVETGDAFSGPIVGVLGYDYGNFKLLSPDPLPAITPGGLVSETTTLAGGDDSLTIASFNVLNLDPSDTTFDELATQIVNHLGSPDIIALEEIQDNSGGADDGTVDASATYAALIAAIQTAGGPVYDYRDVAPTNNQDGGAPGANIRVGFLFQPGRVTFVDRGSAGPTDATQPVLGFYGVQLTLSPGRIDPTNVAFFDSRKPLAGEFVFNGNRLIVIGNHFNSKGGDTPLFGRIQPPNLVSEVQRNLQAQVVNDFVDQILALDTDANIVVLGDLNDFYFSTPISDTLAADVLTNLVLDLPLNERYTYIYDGNSQTLDHILASGNLVSLGASFDIVHVNAEWPAAARPSDHDPVVALFQIPPKYFYFMPIIAR